MEEKKQMKISFSTFLVITIIFTFIVLGILSIILMKNINRKNKTVGENENSGIIASQEAKVLSENIF